MVNSVDSLLEKQTELKKQLKSVKIQLKSVTKSIKSKTRFEKLKENERNGQEAVTLPQISSPSGPLQINQVNSENLNQQEDFHIPNQSQFSVQQVNQTLLQQVNQMSSKNKNPNVTNRYQNFEEIVIKIQNDSNSTVVISDTNSMESSQQSNMHKNESAFNSKKNHHENASQILKDNVFEVQNEPINMVSMNSNKIISTPRQTKSRNCMGENQPINSAPFPLSENDVKIFQDILTNCMSIKNIIDPILKFHCNPTNNVLSSMDNHRTGNNFDCGAEQTNFCQNNRRRGKKNKMKNCQTNWRGTMYRPPMRGYISRGSSSRSRGSGRGQRNCFGRGMHHFRPYFNPQEYNTNFFSHPEIQFVHTKMNPVSDSLEKREIDMLSNNDKTMNKPHDEYKNSETMMENSTFIYQTNTAQQQSQENFKKPVSKSTCSDEIVTKDNNHQKGNKESTENTQSIVIIPRNPDKHEVTNESSKENSHNKGQDRNGKENVGKNKRIKRKGKFSKSKIPNQKLISSQKNLVNDSSQEMGDREITENPEIILQTTGRPIKSTKATKNTRENVCNSQHKKDGLKEIYKKGQAKNKVIANNKVIAKTKNPKARCSLANNGPVRKGLNKPPAHPLCIPPGCDYRSRGHGPRSSLLPYYRPPFYWHYHNFACDNISFFNENVRTTNEVRDKNMQINLDVITVRNNNLPDPAKLNVERNDQQETVSSEQIQQNAISDAEKSSEMNEPTNCESNPNTSDKNTENIFDIIEHAIDLTKVPDTTDKIKEVIIQEENTRATESNIAITKSRNLSTKKCAVTAILEYDDDASQSNTKMLLNNLNNIEPAIKSVYLSVKKHKEISTENVTIKDENTATEECTLDSSSSTCIRTNNKNNSNPQSRNAADFTEKIKINDIKLEKMEIPDYTENEKSCAMRVNIKTEPVIQDTNQINEVTKVTNNVFKSSTIFSPKQTNVKSSSPSKQNIATVTEAEHQINVMGFEYINTVIENTSNVNPKNLKNKSKIYVPSFKNAEMIASVPTALNNMCDINKNINENADDYNIISMEIDDDDYDSDATELLENLCSKSDSDSESDAVPIQDIESDIVEIIDIIKTNPTDFGTLLDIINNSCDGTETDNVLLNDIAIAIGDILKNSSSHSLQTSMSKERVAGRMGKKDRLKRHLKTQHSIQKLFQQLRKTSQYDSPLQGQNSLTDNQNSSQTCIIDLEDSNTTVIPDELRNNLQTNMDNSILVLDDEQKACSTPIRGSLQKASKSIVVEDVVLAGSNNNKSLNETKVINSSSYQTIDLTTDSGFNRTVRSEPTVIEISDTCEDVTLVSANSSMSGDSEVTILRQPINRKLRKFTNGIANLNAEEKGKLLEIITQTIFNGCNVKQGVSNLQRALPRAADTAEDTYIKEVILGTKASRSSVGSNVYHPDRQKTAKTGPRMIVIDGSNVAMEHGRGKYFSVRGLQICINYFLRRGHVVKAFVPRFRCKSGKSSNPQLLDFLERKGLVIYTPSREVQGRFITPYDDRYIIQCAAEFDAVVVSGDHFRDLACENPRWRTVINTRVLPFTWVDDMIMFPRDPLGRDGPTLEEFLKHPGPEQCVRID